MICEQTVQKCIYKIVHKVINIYPLSVQQHIQKIYNKYIIVLNKF